MTAGSVHRVPVVFAIDNMTIGGTELNAVRTAELLDRERFDLRVVSLSEDGPLVERYRSMGIPIVRLPLTSLYGRTMFTSGWRFRSYLREQKVKIVHAHDMYSNIFATPWARVAGTPVVIASRRWWHSLPNRKLQEGNRLAFRMAHAVLANSPQVAKSVAERERVPEERIWMVSNFVDERAFAALPNGEREARRREWGIAPGAVVVGSVARLVPVKDHASLVTAFAELHAVQPDTHLVLVGDGECRAALEAQATTLGVREAVTFTGELRDGGNHHRYFDVSVLCSLSEGFPNSLVEAMAAGLPIVATAVGGNIDAVEDGANGMLVPVQEPRALAKALVALCGDAERRAAMGDEGRARARERYGARSAVNALEAMYDRLLAGAGR